VRGDRELRLDVPAGVATGQYMTVRGVGNAGMRGGPPGDVHVIFDVADDPRFERDGEDLYTELLVTYPQLVLGAEIAVPTVLDSTTVRIPPGTQSGTTFRLRGRGLPRVNGSGTGDLHAKVQVWTPSAEQLNDAERRLIEQLATVQTAPVEVRDKGLWSRIKEALGA
jgi:molecular chaperone DnaJ